MKYENYSFNLVLVFGITFRNLNPAVFSSIFSTGYGICTTFSFNFKFVNDIHFVSFCETVDYWFRTDRYKYISLNCGWSFQTF